MSFILDALRKSEHARQHLGGASLAELPLGRRQRSQPWWVLALAALLLINLIVLTLVLTRKAPEANEVVQASVNSSTTSPVTPPNVVTTGPQASVPLSTMAPPAPAPLSEEALSPPAVQYETIPRNESPLAIDVPEGPTLVKPIERSAPAPAFTANGLPELHIDMHVYAKNPKDRFVLINMHKYTEGQLMSEGPRIDEITADGVTLYFKGQQLSLQRP